MRNKKRFWVVSIIVLVIVGAAFSAYLICPSNQGDESPLAFTKEEWNKNIGERYRMLDSLLKGHTLVGMNKEEILNLLGLIEDDLRFIPVETAEGGYYISQKIRDYSFDKWQVMQIYFNNNDICYTYLLVDVSD